MKYTAKCNNCSHVFDYSRCISERDDIPVCSKCRASATRIFVGPTGGFILKGDGWYKPGAFPGKKPQVDN
jgi:predicted nucleic acid-binding Zn ribbon protein